MSGFNSLTPFLPKPVSPLNDVIIGPDGQPMQRPGVLGSGTYGMDMGAPAQMAPTAPGVTVPLTLNPDALFPNGVDGVPGLGGAAADVAGGGGGGSWWDGALGSTDKNGVRTDGWAGTAVGALGGIAKTYMGMKQYGLAVDQLNESKRQYDANYAAQRTTTNASLEDRQRARVASNSGAYQSVGDYMNKNGVK